MGARLVTPAAVDRHAFRRHVELLSEHLRATYRLGVETRWNNFIFLTGGGVEASFYRGDVREHFVRCRLHFPDEDATLDVDLWAYADRLHVYEQFRPISGIKDDHDQYRFIGSPFQVLEAVIFLAAECGPLLDGDPEAIAAAVELMRN